MALLQQHFYWMKLGQDVNKYIRSCTACAIAKPNTKKQGLYTPLPTPYKRWESISMNYMSGLMYTKWGNDYVFLVVDHFSKMVIWVAYKKNITVEANPSSSLNESGYILESHKQLSHIDTIDFSVHSGRASSHCWTPSSPNP